jgi:aminoglycoside phosphotransferase (APT) family kinase protein
VLGGKGVSRAVAHDAVDILQDLRMVDVDTLPDFVRRFSFEQWQASFANRSLELVERRMLQADTVKRAEELFAELATERYQGNMFTNGDFYPRNFILLPGDRIAVADWVGGIDPWEFVAMHAWLMMWGNADWQAAYIRQINRHFPIDYEEMQVGLLVNTFDRVYGWREHPEELIGLARAQMLSYFRQCLDSKYVQSIFKA